MCKGSSLNLAPPFVAPFSWMIRRAKRWRSWSSAITAVQNRGWVALTADAVIPQWKSNANASRSSSTISLLAPIYASQGCSF